MKRLLLLYNVKAGRNRAYRKLDQIEAIFEQGGYSVFSKLIRFGTNPFDVEGEPYDLVVVCGGDGTINYVVNSMCAKQLNYPLGIIPAGTANDFAGALGMNSRVLKAAQQIVSGSPIKVDCGRVNGLYFVNILSFGMFTTTSQRTPDSIKRRLGKAAYIIEGSKELHNRESIPLHIEHDGGSVDVDSMITLIFNGETAGKFPLARAASLHDGLLDCVLLRKCNIFAGALSAIKYLLVGNPNENIMHLRSSRLKITSPLSPLTDMDGQQCADLPLEVECLKDFLTVIV